MRIALSSIFITNLIKIKKMKTKIHFVLAIVAMVFTISLKAQQCCFADAGTNKSICCAPGSVILGGFPAALDSCAYCDSISYFWQPTASLNNPNLAHPTASPNVTTIYTLCITAYKSDTCRKVCCVTCKTVQVTVSSICCRLAAPGTNPVRSHAVVSMYPNPAKTDFNVEINSEVDNAQIVITDLTGRVVYKKDDIKGKAKVNIDTATLPKGVYLLKINDNGQDVYNDKFIIE
jgi:hypothetical protein